MKAFTLMRSLLKQNSTALNLQKWHKQWKVSIGSFLEIPIVMEDMNFISTLDECLIRHKYIPAFVRH